MFGDGDMLDIAETCRRLGILPADIEAMEEEGLITLAVVLDGKALPSEQMERLEMILRLQRDLGVNLPGIDVILEMRRKMIQMRREVDEILEFIRDKVSRDLREILGEEEYPMALGPGENFLAIERGRRQESGTSMQNED
jgi:MerR family transcriptional regulator/heat shock protein HspR